MILDRYVGGQAFLPLFVVGASSAPADELPETLEETLAGGVLWSAYQA